MNVSQVKKYHEAVCISYASGNTESSYNPALLALMESFGVKASDKSGERGQAKGGNIDIKLWRADDEPAETNPFAGIEVKKVGGIDARAREQAKISARLFGNVILTDNCVWRFYRAGDDEMYTGVELLTRVGDKLELKKENVELFISLVQDFLLQDPALIRSSSKLAEYMAIHAKTIRSVILGILKDDGTGQPLVNDSQQKLPMFPDLYVLYCRIKSELRPYLDSRGFADMYAQTIVYGLFIARYNDSQSEKFDRLRAILRLQEESPLLNRFFNHITTTGKTHPTLDGVIVKLCRLYEICDLHGLLDGDAMGDSIVHFYENFLKYYDPDLRKSLGVFYTPHQVVRYLVDMVDKSLVEDFGIQGGLSNNETLQISVKSEEYQASAKKTSDIREVNVPRVVVLDPACGTGTFHAEIIKFIKKKYFGGSKEMFFKDYVESDGLHSRLIGFEIMMTSYVVAHLNVRRAVEEALGKAESVKTPKIYLTNTLAKAATELERGQQMSLMDFTAAISDEAYNADTWKVRRPIKVIIGNPPYLVDSTIPFDISNYKTETDGTTKLNERNSKMLGDDYVKFFCFAEKIINRNNEGILAFVTPHGYLSNTTFRGMRASLLRTFDKIFIIDLHGNSNLREVAPDGGEDENIFDIKQGIALFIGVKTTSSMSWAKVYHADLWGKRDGKFQQLQTSEIQLMEVDLDEKMAYLIPINKDGKDLYETGINIRELFPVNVFGAKTGNDSVAISSDREELNRRLDIVRLAVDEKAVLELFGKFTRDQTFEKIQNDILTNNGEIVPIDYRPFDKRWTHYSGKSGGWMDMPREKRVMGHLLQSPTSPIGKNIGMVFGRSAPTKNDFAMIFISTTIIDLGLTGTVDKGYVAPLYLHYETINGETWTPNLNNEIVAKLTQNLAVTPNPIEIFDYCYGVLNDPTYIENPHEQRSPQ